MLVQSLCWEDPLEEETATHSSIFVWKIPWTKGPSRLQSIGSRRVGHDQSDLACAQRFNVIALILLFITINHCKIEKQHNNGIHQISMYLYNLGESVSKWSSLSQWQRKIQIKNVLQIAMFPQEEATSFSKLKKNYQPHILEILTSSLYQTMYGPFNHC